MAVFPVNLCKGQCTFAVSLLVFVGCGFQRCPPETEVAGRAVCLNCCTSHRELLALPGQVWTDFSIAGIPRAGSRDLSHRQGEWVSDWFPGSLLSTCSWAPPSWVDCGFPLHFATLTSLRNNMGDLWVVPWVHKPVSPNYFLTLLMCFKKREMKKDYKVHPQPAATHCSAASSRFELSLKIRITKVNMVVSRKPATMSSLLDQNKEPFTASGFFPELQQPVLMCRAWLHKQPAELEKD